MDFYGYPVLALSLSLCSSFPFHYLVLLLNFGLAFALHFLYGCSAHYVALSQSILRGLCILGEVLSVSNPASVTPQICYVVSSVICSVALALHSIAYRLLFLGGGVRRGVLRLVAAMLLPLYIDALPVGKA
jgi:hypothetical protein